MQEKKYDLISYGRSSIDLYSQEPGAPFEEIPGFHVFVGGSPLNIAVGCSKLGLKAALLTGVGRDKIGDFILNFLQKEDVITEKIPVILDLDFRADQWYDIRAFGVTVRAFMKNTSIVLGTEEEVLAAYLSDQSQLNIKHQQISAPEIVGNIDEAIEGILAQGVEALIMKTGSRGAKIYLPDGTSQEVPGFPVKVLNILGAGDAFAAGFIYGLLKGWDLFKSCRMGNACGAWVVTKLGCANFNPYEKDVQTEAFDFPDRFFEKRIWHIPRTPADPQLLKMAAKWIRSSSRPVIVAGGGVIYSEAEESLVRFIEKTGIPVMETFAGKGALPYDHPLNLGAAGATGTEGANEYSERADLVIGIGTRYSDFTTASKTAFQNEKVRFININITEFDAFKQSALALTGDARRVIEDLADIIKEYTTEESYQQEAGRFNREWDQKVKAAYLPDSKGLPSQSEVIGALNGFSDPEDVLVCASGSLPGDLHKLWRTKNSKGFHLEYGYSCMGYEFPGGLGVKMASPEREVYVMVGDGGYLMMPSEIITSLQEDYKLTVILINNQTRVENHSDLYRDCTRTKDGRIWICLVGCTHCRDIPIGIGEKGPRPLSGSKEKTTTFFIADLC